MLRLASTLALLSLLIAPARAQTVTVETLLPAGSEIDDGLIIGPDGALYGSRWGADGGGPGRTVTRVDLHDASTSTYADGLNRSNGLGFDGDGNLYVANYGARTLERIAPDGTRSTYATVLTGNLSGVLVHPTTGVIYVTNYTANTVGIATGDGTLTPFLSNGGRPQLNGPVGMAVDDEGRLYVSNFNDGKIFRVTEGGEMTEIADLEGPNFSTTGFIAYGGGAIYATNIGNNIIERVSLADGSVETIAGSGAQGTVDGPGETARFNAPNGIASNAAGDTLYVSEERSRAVRRIVIGAATSAESSAVPTGASLLLQAYPNPSAASSVLRFRLERAGRVTVAVYDVLGRRVRLVTEAERGAGWHEVALDTSTLAPGIYLADVRTAEARATQRLHVVR